MPDPEIDAALYRSDPRAYWEQVRAAIDAALTHEDVTWLRIDGLRVVAIVPAILAGLGRNIFEAMGSSTAKVVAERLRATADDLDPGV